MDLQRMVQESIRLGALSKNPVILLNNSIVNDNGGVDRMNMQVAGGGMTRLLLVLAVLLACAGTAWIVDDSGGAGVDYASMQAAVAAASEGDSIGVWGGTYRENVDEEATSVNTYRS